MKISLPYGKGSIEAQLPAQARVTIVEPQCPPLEGTDEERIEAALDAPIGTPKLEEMADSTKRVLIVVNDHTRPGPNKEIAAALLRRLKKAGVPDGNIRFIC